MSLELKVFVLNKIRCSYSVNRQTKKVAWTEPHYVILFWPISDTCSCIPANQRTGGRGGWRGMGLLLLFLWCFLYNVHPRIVGRSFWKEFDWLLRQSLSTIDDCHISFKSKLKKAEESCHKSTCTFIPIAVNLTIWTFFFFFFLPDVFPHLWKHVVWWVIPIQEHKSFFFLSTESSMKTLWRSRTSMKVPTICTSSCSCERNESGHLWLRLRYKIPFYKQHKKQFHSFCNSNHNTDYIILKSRKRDQFLE